MSEATNIPQIALARVDGLLNKVFAISMVLLTIDVFQNAIRQLDYLNPIWLWITLSALLISVLGLLVSAFFVGRTKYWYRAVVLVVLLTLLTWGFQLRQDAVLPPDFKPWIWWALGFAIIAVGGGWNRMWVYLAVIIGPIIWVIVAMSPSGGEASLLAAIEDSSYTMLFTIAISLLVLELKDRASELDNENNSLIQASLERVRLEALRIERTLLNSMLIDKSLTALRVAAEAISSEQKSKAATLSMEAINQLDGALSRRSSPPEFYGVEALITPLVNALYNRFPEFKVTVKGTTDLALNSDLVSGITEATLLAASNSITHAPGASERYVKITLSGRGLKIVVSDNGRGFRMSSVHKTALGVRWAIFRRLESLGATAKLDSKLGIGTTWIFEWHP